MNIIEFESIPQQSRTLNLQLLKRIDPYALYITECTSFEIHKIRMLSDYYNKFTDTLYRKKEKIASSAEFGVHAWSYDTLTHTLECYPQFKPFKQEILEKLNDLGYTQKHLSVKGGKYFKL